MTWQELTQYVLLPAVGWLLLNSNSNQRRLTRVETKLDDLLERCNKICKV